MEGSNKHTLVNRKNVYLREKIPSQMCTLAKMWGECSQVSVQEQKTKSHKNDSNEMQEGFGQMQQNH